MSGLPNNLITYGPLENCTLAICPVKSSIFQYRPSLAANSVFIALFGISLIIHVVQGVRWKTWAFLFAMVWGCIAEMLGYGGRIILYNNPFSFPGFMIEICCITLAPVFYTAAIYLTLAKIVVYLDPSYCRFSPKVYYWLFIPCDILSLTLQGTGGGLSSTSSGSSKVAVDVSLVGLSFQVFTLTVFIALALDYAIRYSKGRRTQHTEQKPLPKQFKIFVYFLSLSIILILARCVYRIDELSDGYHGKLLHNEGLFIGLEGVLVVVACFCLNVAHPGPVFGRKGDVPSQDLEHRSYEHHSGKTNEY